MIVLDTHAWLWWRASPERLSPAASEAIDQADAIGVSAISCWEVGMLVRLGRIGLSEDARTWTRRALAHARVTALGVTPEIATEAGLLDGPQVPGDPTDRLIYATAKHERADLVTRDATLHALDPRRTVW